MLISLLMEIQNIYDAQPFLGFCTPHFSALLILGFLGSVNLQRVYMLLELVMLNLH